MSAKIFTLGLNWGYENWFFFASPSAGHSLGLIFLLSQTLVDHYDLFNVYLFLHKLSKGTHWIKILTLKNTARGLLVFDTWMGKRRQEIVRADKNENAVEDQKRILQCKRANSVACRASKQALVARVWNVNKRRICANNSRRFALIRKISYIDIILWDIRSLYQQYITI